MKQEIAKNDYDKILDNIVKYIEQSKLRAFSEVTKLCCMLIGA